MALGTTRDRYWYYTVDLYDTIFGTWTIRVALWYITALYLTVTHGRDVCRSVTRSLDEFWHSATLETGLFRELKKSP